MTDYISQTETNKLIRKVLRESFPGVKFSVRTRGGSTNINWTDGPNANQVERLVSAFEGSYFDGMIDYQGSRFAMLDGREVRFMADFIFTNRHYSDDVERMMAQRLIQQYGPNANISKTPRLTRSLRIGIRAGFITCFPVVETGAITTLWIQ